MRLPALLIAVTVFCALPVRAQTPAAKPGLPTLHIGPLVNKGGAGVVDPDGTPLYTGFARALALALKAEGEAAPLPFTVETPRAAPVKLAPVPRFRLEGELSVSGTEGPYLCVLRLVDTAGKGRVAAQWAGVAQTLRDLTGNLSRDSRVHSLGLAGEFARRVTGATRGILTPNPGALNEAFAKRVAESGKTNRLTLEAVLENGKAGDTLAPGAKFRLRVATHDAGDIYVFALNKQNQPVAAFVQADIPVVLPGRPVLLPATGAPFSLRKDAALTFVAVLVRRPDIALAEGVASSAVPAVIVLNGSAKLPDAPTDPLVARLMALLKTKKPDEMLSAHLTVKAAKIP
jgi:hypothetical protein